VGVAEPDRELPQQVEPLIECQILEVLGEELIQSHSGRVVLEDQGGPQFAFLEMQDAENTGVVDTL
jgi:hypothetical protein